MSDTMAGTYGQDLSATDPLHRVDPLDRDSPDRDHEREEDGTPRRKRPRLQPPPEDRVEISEEARRALAAIAAAAAAEPDKSETPE